MGKRDDINLDKLAEACERWKVDVHDVIAESLTPEMRADKESGMTMARQSDLAWKIVDKLEASKKAIEHSGSEKSPVRLIIEG